MRRLIVGMLALTAVGIALLAVFVHMVNTGRPARKPVAAPTPFQSPAPIDDRAMKGTGETMVEPINGTSGNFDTEVLQSETPVVVDFWASWCGPCRMVSPILDELASEYQGKVKVVKVNVDEERELAGKYQIQAIPTILFFKDGKLADKVIGAESKKSLAARFEKLSSAS